MNDDGYNVYWVSVAPWLSTGYGQQTAIQTEMIANDHNVRIGAISGLQGTPTPWRNNDTSASVEVWSMRDSLDFIEQYVQFGADFAVTLFDLWAEGDEAPDMFKYARAQQVPIRVGAWLPIDTQPLGRPDMFKLAELEGIITPIAMSRHGYRMLKAEGLEPLYIPHSIDTHVFSPHSSQQECRRRLGIDTDKFIIGINAFNSIRKAWYEQLSAFAIFHKRYPGSHLLIHSIEQRSGDDGTNLLLLIDHLGLNDCIGFSDQFGYRHGLLTANYLSQWYNAIDVLSVCSYGEGFGIPYIEAQACGTPAIGTNAAAAVELLPYGWLADGQEYWSAFHNAYHKIPNVGEIAKLYELAYLERKDQTKDRGVTQWQNRSNNVRDFACRYDKESVYKKFWIPTLAKLGSRPNG